MGELTEIVTQYYYKEKCYFQAHNYTQPEYEGFRYCHSRDDKLKDFSEDAHPSGRYLYKYELVASEQVSFFDAIDKVRELNEHERSGYNTAVE